MEDKKVKEKKKGDKGCKATKAEIKQNKWEIQKRKKLKLLDRKLEDIWER